MTDAECELAVQHYVNEFYETYCGEMRARFPRWQEGGFVGPGFLPPLEAQHLAALKVCAIVPDPTGELAAHVRKTWVPNPSWRINPSDKNNVLVVISYQ